MRKAFQSRFQIVSTLLFIALLQAAVSAEVIKEGIAFIESDGEHGVLYDTTRSDNSHYNLWFEKGTNLDAYLYLYPNNYKWDRTDARQDVLRLPGGDYATMQRKQKLTAVKREGDIFTWQTSRKKASNGRYGVWNTPDDFDHFTYLWVLPDNLEIVDYTCNREGDWVLRDNALAFFGKDLNDVVFTVRYQAKSASATKGLESAVSRLEGVSVERDGADVKVVLEDQILFPSGVSSLSSSGREALGWIVRALAGREGLRVIVEGHTDDVPVRGDLAKRYPTNWELSAARAVSVVRHLRGLNLQAPVEARAFSSERPRASNSTSQGRAKNRRIEIRIVHQP